MILDAKTGKLRIHQVDVDHIIGWFVDGCTLQEAIEMEVRLHGLEGKWKFNANKIDFDNSGFTKEEIDEMIERTAHPCMECKFIFDP